MFEGRITIHCPNCGAKVPVNIGKKPYGYYAGEPETLQIMRDLKKDGATLAVITQNLNLSGIKARSGKAWSLGAVAKILSRQCNERNV